MSQVAILARVTVKEGKAGPYLAAPEPLLEQARKEPGTLLYAVHRSADDPQVFWTTEIYADDAAFAAHRATKIHADAEPVFTDLIAAADVTIGETSWRRAWTDDMAAAPQTHTSARHPW